MSIILLPIIMRVFSRKTLILHVELVSDAISLFFFGPCPTPLCFLLPFVFNAEPPPHIFLLLTEGANRPFSSFSPAAVSAIATNALRPCAEVGPFF